ncbi:hypothetical protein NOC27_1374 [Nitrosococcus oceani AFC27]|nr:hypothetical protein NOC27_1374 [Nitrosococcus oceani AFC27]
MIPLTVRGGRIDSAVFSMVPADVPTLADSGALLERLGAR